MRHKPKHKNCLGSLKSRSELPRCLKTVTVAVLRSVTGCEFSNLAKVLYGTYRSSG